MFLGGFELHFFTFFVNFRVLCWCGVVWCWCWCVVLCGVGVWCCMVLVCGVVVLVVVPSAVAVLAEGIGIFCKYLTHFDEANTFLTS